MKKDELHTLIDSILHKQLDKVYTNILVEYRKIQNDFGRRNMLRSGAFIQTILKMITSKLTNNCKETISLIINLQDDLNIVFVEENRDYSIEKLLGRYNKVIDSIFQHEINGGKLNLNFMKDTSTQKQLNENMLRQNLKGIIPELFNDDALKSRLRKDDDAVKIAKRANIIGWVAIVISIVGVLIAVLLNK